MGNAASAAMARLARNRIPTADAVRRVMESPCRTDDATLILNLPRCHSDPAVAGEESRSPCHSEPFAVILSAAKDLALLRVNSARNLALILSSAHAPATPR